MDLSQPASPLPLPWPAAQGSAICVVTGWRGAGKTTWCLRAVETYRQAGLKVTGLVTPGRYAEQQRTGIYARDLDSGVTKLLASRVPGELDGLRFKAWTFDSSVFDWGNQRLRQSPAADVLVLDELGFLEFDLQAGWMDGFGVLREKNYRLALVVIRPECIEPFRKMGFDFQIIDINKSQGQPNPKV